MAKKRRKRRVSRKGRGVGRFLDVNVRGSLRGFGGGFSSPGSNSAWNELNRLQHEQYGLAQKKWQLDRRDAERKMNKGRREQMDQLAEQRETQQRDWKKQMRKHEEEREDAEVDFQKKQVALRENHVKEAIPKLQEAAKKEAELRIPVYPSYPGIPYGSGGGPSAAYPMPPI